MAARPRSVSARKPPYAPSTCSQAPCPDATRCRAGRSSTAPVLVLPAAATTHHGTSPAAASAAIASASASGRIRNRSSIATSWMRSIPISRSARPTDEWASVVV